MTTNADQMAGVLESTMRTILGDDAYEASIAQQEARRDHAKLIAKDQMERRRVITGLWTTALLATVSITPPVIIAAWRILL